MSVTFHRVITAEVGMAAAGTLAITFDEFGRWGSGLIDDGATTVTSRAVQISPSYHTASITGGANDYSESYVLPGTSGGVTTGDDEIAIPSAGQWLVTFYCAIVLNPVPDNPQVVVDHVSTVPPWIQAVIAGATEGSHIEEFLVPWIGDD